MLFHHCYKLVNVFKNLAIELSLDSDIAIRHLHITKLERILSLWGCDEGEEVKLRTGPGDEVG